VRSEDLDDAYLCDTIVDIWTMSRRSYASPWVHAELKLGQDVHCSRKRVERLMRQAPGTIAGIFLRRCGDCTRRDLDAQPSDDLVKRAFDPEAPDGSWTSPSTRLVMARPIGRWSSTGGRTPRVHGIDRPITSTTRSYNPRRRHSYCQMLSPVEL
jgi:hypothetical protein